MSNFLVGKVISGIKIAEDKKALLFSFEGAEDAIVRVDGDCCSESWVEHVELPALGFPATVSAVRNLDLHDKDEEKDYELIQHYGCNITTDKGEIVIDYRNSSNGYYGGYMVWPGESYYGGVYQQNVSENQWRDVE